MIVVPRASTAAMTAFSVPVTDASSRYMSAPRRPPGRRQPVLAVGGDLGAQAGEGHQVRVDAAAADHVAARRRDVGGAEAGQQRAGEQDRGPDARAQLGVQRVFGRPPPTPGRGSGPATRPPRRCRTSSSIIASTSRMRGTLSSVTGSAVSTQAARIGSAAFLFPAGRTVPESGTPALDHEGLDSGFPCRGAMV